MHNGNPGQGPQGTLPRRWLHVNESALGYQTPFEHRCRNTHPTSREDCRGEEAKPAGRTGKSTNTPRVCRHVWLFSSWMSPGCRL